jgi:selenide,water dikinase
MGGEMIPCGGCAAKVGADLLARVLGRLEIPPREGVLIGLDQPDDAAVFVTPPGTVAVATTDAFPPFTDDLYLVGRVAAANAASDLYAMGAEGAAAIALVCLPEGNPRRQELQLEHVLRGALRTLESLQIPLVGGHTIAGEQALVGFSMHGFANPEHILRKSGARPGDCLVLSKALGTGVVLAAARAGFADTEWVEETHRSMLRANRAVMHILRAHAVHACTDVSGFGLMGHLAEMLGASSATAHLDATAVPALPGARELLDNGWRSSFHATNERAQANGSVGGIAPLLIDPQTSGGLLAAVPRDALAALQKACAEQNEEIYVIGEIGAPSSANPSGSVIVE